MPDGQPVLVKRISLRAYAGTYVVLALLALAIWAVGFLTEIGADAGIPPAAIAVGGLVPLLLGIAYTWLVRASTQYRVFEDAIEVESGILSKDIDNLQLFRVRDLGLRQSLSGRVLSIGDITITSTDRSTPHLIIRGVGAPRDVYETLRKLVSASQATRRTMVVEDDTPPSR
jgi:uncharacterized membrane protein YdbT with pleckstrin-like domain